MHPAWRTALRLSRAFLAALCVLSASAVLAADEGEVLTNQSIVEMTKARLGTAVIVQQVRSLPGRYALSSRDLVKLKQQGVADEVILAMQQKGAQGKQAPAPEAARTPARAEWPAFEWRLRTFTPPKSTSEVPYAAMWQPFEIGSRAGRVEVTYYCGGEIEYRLDFGGDPSIAFKWNQPVVTGSKDVYWEDHTDPNGFPHFSYGTEYQYAGGRDAPWIELNVSIDGEDNRLRSSVGSRNALRVQASQSDLKRARSVRAFLPLEDLRSIVVEFDPSNSEFRELLARCADYVRRIQKLPTIAEHRPCPGAPMSDGFRWSCAWNGPVRFRSSVDELAAKIRAAIDQRGLAARDYEKEIAFVVQTVRTCAGITPAMVAGAPLAPPNEHSELQLEDLSALPREYQQCSRWRLGATEELGIQGHRRLFFGMEPRGIPRRWGSGQGLEVIVGLLAQDDDPLKGREGFLSYGLLDGVVLPGRGK